MYNYSTLENTTNKILYDTFLEAFQGFPIVSKANIEDFYILLKNNEYDPLISVGAFRGGSNELVAFALNSIRNVGDKRAAYIILTGTKPLYRRQSIMNNIFEKSKELLRQKKASFWFTEVLVTNVPALKFYQAQGFGIKNEVTTVVSTKAGNEQVLQYEIAITL